MPDNHVRPEGMENCKFPVDNFMKVFCHNTFEMLLEQTNIHRRDVNKKKERSLLLAWGTEAGRRHPFLHVCCQYAQHEAFLEEIHEQHSRLQGDDKRAFLGDCQRPPHVQQPISGYDKLFKVRKLLNHITKNFKNSAEMEKILSVDEQMIPYKGTIQLKVYMKNKPEK
jgi:hypothetical protein